MWWNWVERFGGRCSQCDLFVEIQRPHVVKGCMKCICIPTKQRHFDGVFVQDINLSYGQAKW